MSIVFAGTPEFAAVHLRALLKAGVTISAVLSQPDRPAGRGQKLTASPVKEIALAHNLTILQPRSLRLDGKFPEDAAQAKAQLESLTPQLMIVVAYGLILPQWTLDLPSEGCVNAHASLLPRWRGAAPIQRAIEAGDAQTAVALMDMEAGLDTGGVYAQNVVNLTPQTYASQLTQEMADLSATLLVKELPNILNGSLKPNPQAQEGVTYAAKLTKEEAVLDWRLSAETLARKINAFEGSLGISSEIDGKPLKIWRAQAVDFAHAQLPSSELKRDKNEWLIACGQGALRIIEAQKAGGKRLGFAQFLQSW